MAVSVITTDDWFKAIRCSKYPLVTKYIHEFKGKRCSMEWTALMWAAKFGDIKMVELLAEHEHSLVNDNMETALMIACRFRNYHAANILVEYEAGKQDKLGWTALMWLSVMGGVDTANLLVTREACKQDKDGQTALMLSIEKGHYDISALLLSYEARMATKNGLTALMKASMLGNQDVVRRLAPYELGMQDSKGKTALMHAIMKRNTWLFDVLSPEASIVDLENITPFELARKEGLDSYHLLNLLLTRRYLDDQRRNLWLMIILFYISTTSLKLLFGDSQTIIAINDLTESFLSLLFDDLDLTATSSTNADEFKVGLKCVDKNNGIDSTHTAMDWNAYHPHSSFIEPLMDTGLKAIEDLNNNIDIQPCAVCLDFICEVVFLPCKHCVTCRNCTEAIKAKCPYCREEIKDMIQLDYSFETPSVFKIIGATE
ncbi:Ser/Thr protein kinase [Giardia lamblia P15]|uniref:Ser/Thr protein kinase n=1 Tax=Giardia intestinalis (strain P15) TaxID=658858 RepID=E1EVK3_GIAIA|nr:Ser/Thr protein kinase [Giardia lamblia P15]